MWSNSKKKVQQIQCWNCVCQKDRNLLKTKRYHSVIAHYQDGSQASLKADQIDVKTRLVAKEKPSQNYNKGLELREAGLVHLEANYQGT